jgi:hypothetical protein
VHQWPPRSEFAPRSPEDLEDWYRAIAEARANRDGATLAMLQRSIEQRGLAPHFSAAEFQIPTVTREAPMPRAEFPMEKKNDDEKPADRPVLPLKPSGDPKPKDKVTVAELRRAWQAVLDDKNANDEEKRVARTMLEMLADDEDADEEEPDDDEKAKALARLDADGLRSAYDALPRSRRAGMLAAVVHQVRTEDRARAAADALERAALSPEQRRILDGLRPQAQGKRAELHGSQLVMGVYAPAAVKARLAELNRGRR